MDLKEKQELIENIVRENFYKHNHQDKVYIIDQIKFLDNVSPVFGRCSGKRHIFNFFFNSPAMEKMNKEQITELAIHEVAHAVHQMRYKKLGHTKEFYNICKELGSKNPSRYCKDDLPGLYRIGRYVYKCTECGAIHLSKIDLHSYKCGCKGKLQLIKYYGKNRWFSEEEVKELKSL